MAAMTMAALAVGQGVMELSSAYSQSEAKKLQGKYQKELFDHNSRMAGLQAEDALRRGDREANQQRKKARQVQGSQRAALAAQGIDVDLGSAAEIQDETIVQGERDAQTVRNNAWREAWGYRAQAEDAASRGLMGDAIAQSDARNTLITGGMNAAGSFAKAGRSMDGSGFGNRKSKPKRYDYSQADGQGGGIKEYT
jgi:hypothetical protein